MKRKGLSLLELLIVIMVIGTLITAAMSDVWKDVTAHNLKEDVRGVEQFIEEAKSVAIKSSSLTIVDFSEASTNHDENGGKISIKKNDGGIIDTIYLSKNVLFDTSSTIGQSLRFNFKGEPVDSLNLTDGFTKSNNTITLKYSGGGSSGLIRKLQVLPVSGKIEIMN